METRIPGLPPPPPGRVDLGDLHRLAPLSDEFGYDRGRPVDRAYIEGFLDRHGSDVRGRVLEVGDDSYTRRFGGSRVDRRDVLHVEAGHDQATFVGDLVEGAGLPTAAFDCVILTQTLHLIFDVSAALATLDRILAPGGTLLLTVPGISPVARDQWGAAWYWSFTPQALERCLREAMADSSVEVEAHGNVLTSIAFLVGMADHELSESELAVDDPAFPMLVTGRVTKHGRTE